MEQASASPARTNRLTWPWLLPARVLWLACSLASLAIFLTSLPPYAALALFALPALALLPIKLLALWLIGQGRALLGALVILATKVIGTAIVARGSLRRGTYPLDCSS